MNQLVLLDIDGVLLPWNDDAYGAHRQGAPFDSHATQTGFSDWVDPKTKFFTFFSREQIELIRSLGTVVWLSTWILHDKHSEFETITGAGPWKPFGEFGPDKGQALKSTGWWKADHLLSSVEADPDLFRQFDRILWVDDDHTTTTPWGDEFMEEVFRRNGLNVVRIAPDPVWKRSQIEAWL